MMSILTIRLELGLLFLLILDLRNLTYFIHSAVTSTGWCKAHCLKTTNKLVVRALEKREGIWV